MTEETGEAQTMRLDRLLVYLRFARTRSIARTMIEKRALRLNRKHVERISAHAAIGDVLTMMVGGEVRVVKVLDLPGRRVSAAQAKTYYSELDRNLDH